MVKKIPFLVFLIFVCAINVSCSNGAKFISSHGYNNCLELSNGACRVVLEPNCGGRVLVYELDGENVLFINPDQNGFIAEPGVWSDPPGKHLSAGRFDVGPEKIKPDTRIFWYGKWTAEITGKFSARLTSQVSQEEHLQLVRDFVLDPQSSELKVTQTIKNMGDVPRKLCYWSRTFAVGGGICIVPLSQPNRFPTGYINYDAGNIMLFKPELEENIEVSDGYCTIKGAPKRPKFVFDSDKGWLAYITKSNRIFLKKYPFYKDKEYGELTAVPL